MSGYGFSVTAADGQTLRVGASLAGAVATLFDDAGCTHAAVAPSLSAYRATSTSRTFYVAAAGSYVVGVTDDFGNGWTEDVTLPAAEPVALGPFTPGVN